MLRTKKSRRLLSLLLATTLSGSLLVPAVSAETGEEERANQNEAPLQLCETAVVSPQMRSITSELVIDDNAVGGYEGDYVVIYNPSTSPSTSYSTGTMTGLIETSVTQSVGASMASVDSERPYQIDVDPMLASLAKNAEANTSDERDEIEATTNTRVTYQVGSLKDFKVYVDYSPTGTGTIEFECLHVGQHCYIWTPSSNANDTYPLDEIDASYAEMAANEFDAKYDLMRASFGNHTNSTNGDGKLHILYYNINDGWTPGRGYVGGFFYPLDISRNGLPILNIDTYPAVYYQDANGVESKSIDGTYNTTVHEYQHLINYSNTNGMETWLNEAFSAAAEEICYPGSSVVSRIQAWENYNYASRGNWLNPPKEFKYTSSYNLHKGYSMYNWDNNLSDVLALYGQVSLFSQYLYGRFGNTIYKQISDRYTSSETAAITSATGVNCADLVRDFRVALTANAARSQYNGRYSFKAQDGYNPSEYHNVQSPYDLLAPIVFTGSSCSIKGGGAITIKPVGGVYNPPAGANANLRYIGIKRGTSSANPAYTVTATSNNTAYGTVSVNGNVITATPKAGYYAASYTVTSGSATVTQNGNTFTVNPSSNCTVRINFAAKTKITVTCIANGATYTTLTPYSGEAFTLPSTATNVSGYTFVGWSSSTVAETSTKPSYFEPGASVSGTSNATLYAVYSRTVNSGSNGDQFQLLQSAPANWAGNYVITYGTNTSSLYVLKGLSGNVKYESASAGGSVLLADSGMSYANSALSGATAPYIFKIAANGTKYTIQNSSTGTYVGSYNAYLYSRAAYESSSCLWTLSCSNGNISATNSASSSYPYLSFNTSSKYFLVNSSAPTGLYFWKQGGGAGSTTYYTTSPSANGGANPAPAPTTNYTVSFSVPNGVSAVASKTVAAGSTITLPTAGAPAGHTFVGWVTSAVSNTTVKPSALTGSYTVTGNITLRALYSYTTTNSTGSGDYMLLGATPTNWAGNYVITFGTNTSSLYVLKGISGNTSYESSNSGGTVSLSQSGITFAGTGASDARLTGVSNAYVFNIAADGAYYTIKNASTNTYLASVNSYLNSRSSYSSSYCRWTLSCSNGNMTVKNTASSSYSHLSCYNSGSRYFAMDKSTPTGLYFWKQASGNNSSTTYYTTG